MFSREPWQPTKSLYPSEGLLFCCWFFIYLLSMDAHQIRSQWQLKHLKPQLWPSKIARSTSAMTTKNATPRHSSAMALWTVMITPTKMLAIVVIICRSGMWIRGISAWKISNTISNTLLRYERNANISKCFLHWCNNGNEMGFMHQGYIPQWQRNGLHAFGGWPRLSYLQRWNEKGKNISRLQLARWGWWRSQRNGKYIKWNILAAWRTEFIPLLMHWLSSLLILWF